MTKIMDDREYLISQTQTALTAEQEYKQFTKLRETVAELERLEKKKHLTVPDKRMITRLRRKRTDLRTFLVKANFGLVIRMMQTKYASYCDDATLISEASLRLLASVDKFDPTRGFKFSTYACRAIINGISRTNIIEGKHVIGRVSPVDNQDGSVTNFFMGIEDTSHQPDQGLRMDVLQLLEQNHADLDEMQSFVIRMYHGLGQADTHTFAQIAHIVGLSKGRVQQLHASAIKQLRTYLEQRDKG